MSGTDSGGEPVAYGSDEELRRLLLEEADGSLFSEIIFTADMAVAVRSRFGSDMRREPITRARPQMKARLFDRSWGTLVATAVLVIAIIVGWPRVAGEMGLGYYPPGVTPVPPGRAAQPGDRASGRPAPLPFPHGFQVAADPFPVAVGQATTIESEAGWPGRWVWVYAAPAEDHSVLLYDRELPSDVVLIDRLPIVDGRWSLSWTVPQRLEHVGTSVLIGGEETHIYLVAVTDDGYLAALGLPIGPPRSLRVSPDPVSVGQELTIEGGGYPPSTRLRIDLLHDRPDGGTDLQVVIGWATTDVDGGFTFRYLIPPRLNWPYADAQGRMTDHWLDVGQGGRYYLQVLENHPGQGPGPALFKQVGISQP